MDIISLLLIVSACVNALLGLAFLWHAERTTAVWIYIMNIIFILLWILTMYFFREAGTETINLWLDLLYISATLIASSFVCFTYFFPKPEPNTLLLILIGLSNIAIVGLILFSDAILYDVIIRSTGENIIRFGEYYWIYALYILFGFVYGYVRLSKKAFLDNNSEEGRHALIILMGYITAGIIAFFTNLLAPWFGYYALNWTGQIATIIMVASAFYAIVYNELFNAKLISTEIFVGLLWVFALMRSLYSSNSEAQIVNLVFLATVIVIGVILIRSVSKEVEARERAEELTKELKEANNELQFMDEQKSKMLSIASHQFRSPLTAIKGYTSLIKKGSYGEIPDKLMEPINRIFKSSSNLAHVVDDFLNISRIEQGRMDYNFEQADVKEIVEEVVEEAEAAVKDKRVSLSFTSDQTKHYPARLDVSKFKQVITNLVDNAIKYTEEGSVTVQLVRRNRKIEISVEDTGIGIKPKDTEAIFEQFSRADEANDVNVIGTGLGLYIAKQIVEAHGGKIWASSPGKGEGSTFHVEIDVLKDSRATDKRREEGDGE